jgi:hypothetical protein
MQRLRAAAAFVPLVVGAAVQGSIWEQRLLQTIISRIADCFKWPVVKKLARKLCLGNDSVRTAWLIIPQGKFFHAHPRAFDGSIGLWSRGDRGDVQGF